MFNPANTTSPQTPTLRVASFATWPHGFDPKRPLGAGIVPSARCARRFPARDTTVDEATYGSPFLCPNPFDHDVPEGDAQLEKVQLHVRPRLRE
jgi:hypothetical protein